MVAATGAYEDTDIEWQARGTVGRARGSNKPRPAWRMPLENYVALAAPITISEIRSHEQELRAVKAELESEYTGGLYFPFGFSDKRELRAQQTYFVKMPKAILSSLSLDYLSGSLPPLSAGRTKGRSPKRGRSGYIADALVRSAIEMRAVSIAISWYVSRGYTWSYTGNSEPYDIVVDDGSEVRRVEVKGSSGYAEKVELTSGEVDNARAFSPTDLFVVDGIQFSRASDGTVGATGGAARVFHNWTPANEDLKITRYRHTLPAGGKELGEL